MLLIVLSGISLFQLNNNDNTFQELCNAILLSI